MLLILENSKIKGIDKKLLNLLKIDLNKLAEIINIIDLQIDSLTSKPLKINEYEFEISEIEILSLENIKIFELTLKEKSEPLKTQNINTEEFSFEPKIESDQTIEPEISLQPNEEISIEPQISIEEPKEKTQPNEEFSFEPKISQEEKPQADTENSLFEEKNLINQTIQNTEELIKDQNDTSEEIELTFEDDLAEIRKILQLSTNEFNNLINQELQKASDELGISLNDLTQWYKQLIDQINNEKSTIYKYIKKEDYENLHKSYHKLKGAALNLRLSQIALILKKLDELSKNKEPIDKIKHITDDFYNLIEHKGENKIQIQTPKKETIEKIKKDKFIEDIILQTIKNYLNTQNEAQFQKDKKYIEKLLDMKINSIEELQNLIKGL
jgi:HPt (histidine-containing phosphotransfer) domain-containing protein